MIKVQIDRKTWIRGVDDAYCENDVRLRNQEGNQCCLGFVCKKLGLTDANILNVATPGSFSDSEYIQDFAISSSKLKEIKNKITPALLTVRGHEEKLWVRQAIAINDDVALTEQEREEKLSKLFLKNGFDLKFIGPEVNPFTEK